MADTSGPVVPGRWGVTLWTWPASGTFAADRTELIGNESSAFGQVGIDLEGVRMTRPDVSLADQYNLDGVDLTNVTYGGQIVTFPVVIYGGTALEAHVEWRRIQAAVQARERRAALQVWDPSTSVQDSRWLTELVFVDSSDAPIEHDNQSWLVGRMQFATLGSPFWTPEPVAANEVDELVVLADTSVHQLYVTNPGDVSVWPSFQISAIRADIQIQLGGTPKTVVITRDSLEPSGNGEIETDRRVRAPEDDSKVTAASVYFRLPPGESRLDINYFNPFGGWSPAGNSYVRATILPAWSTC